MSSIDFIEISLLKYRMEFYANWGKSFRAYGNKTKSLSRWSGKSKSPIFFSDIFIGDWKKFDHWFRLKNWIELNWIELNWRRVSAYIYAKWSLTTYLTKDTRDTRALRWGKSSNIKKIDFWCPTMKFERTSGTPGHQDTRTPEFC